MTQKERLDFMEFRMDLLREESDFSKYIYDCKISKDQLNRLFDIMDDLRSKIDEGKEVSSVEYETKVLSIVDNKTLDYHFCEEFAKLLWEERRYEEVFPALYGQEIKFKSLFK